MKTIATIAVLLVLAVIQAAATTYVVKPDGTGQFPTIQAAIDFAWDEDIIELTDGSFTGDGNRDLDYQGKRISVRSQSGDPDLCVIDCQATYEDRHLGVVFHSGEGPESVLQGIKIRGGISSGGGAVYCRYVSSPTIIDCIFSDNESIEKGGAVRSRDGSSPSFTNCQFISNYAEVHGGGMFCGIGSTVSLTDCVFLTNTAMYGGGLQCEETPYGSLTGCDFSENVARRGGGGGASFTISTTLSLDSCSFLNNESSGAYGGAGLYCYDAGIVHLTDCIFSENVVGDNTLGGGGFFCYGPTNVVLEECTFSGNEAVGSYGAGAGVASVYAGMGFTGCIFEGNTANYAAGGVYVDDGTADFEFCTFTGNSASGYGGGLLSTGTPTVLTSSTFHDNAAGSGGHVSVSGGPLAASKVIFAFSTRGEAIGCDAATFPTLSCCDVYGNADGDWIGCIADQYGIEGNFSEDPLFCAPDIGDFTLQNTSPCAPENNPECGQIGSLPVGCAAAGVPELYPGGEIGRIFPSPTSGSVEIGFRVPTQGWIHAYILDVTGRVVRCLFEGSYPNVYAGEFSLIWDGLDDMGRRVPSGVYITRLVSPSGVTTGRVVLAR